MGEILRDRGEYGKALKTLKKGLKKSEEKESLQYDLGLVYDRAGQFDESIQAMRKVLKMNPQNANALNYIGYSYADRGVHLDEALELLLKALLLKPEDGFIVDSVGWAYYQRGELGQASVYLKRAYDMVPEEPTIAEHLGDLSLKKGEKEKALRYYREALSALGKKIEGDNERLKPDLERVRQKIEKL